MTTLAILPLALLFDFLLGEAPSRFHPVCMIGTLANRLEASLWQDSFWRGVLACLGTILPSAALTGGVVFVVQSLYGNQVAGLVTAFMIYLCLAPRSLAEHALRVAEPLARGDIDQARQAVSMIVGRQTGNLDEHGVARACVESVAENLTDGVLATLFWAGIGLLFESYAGAACLAVLHRSTNTLDALWGKKNERYRHFGTLAAKLDDLLNFFPARLALPCIALVAKFIHELDAQESFKIGWKYHTAHESPNSAWSEAAFAGALHLTLGGSATYGTMQVDHPWLGEGTQEATYQHILLAVQLMKGTVILFALCEILMLMVM